MIDWVAEPHFFRCGTAIALYLGKNETLLNTLQALCGFPFAPAEHHGTPTVVPTPTLPSTVTRTVIYMENGLTWTECVVPDRKYSLMREDWEFLVKCVPPPESDIANDKAMRGERVELPQGFSDFKTTIGKDHFETRLFDYPQKGCCNYKLLKNGKIILKESTRFTTYDPNLGFWNIGGKLVWELGGWTSVIVVDGIDFNEQYQLQGSYKPHEIKGKLIYIARQNGKLHVVYDGQAIGPEFDDISMPNCCGMVWLYRGNGQYWFLGSRGGEKVLVSIQ